MTNGNDVVYPIVNGTGHEGVHSVGITKREYFAAMAMQGFIASCDTSSGPDDRVISSWSVCIADELIKALNTIEPQ